MFAGRVKIVSHSSCRTSAILKYFCPLIILSNFTYRCRIRRPCIWNKNQESKLLLTHFLNYLPLVGPYLEHTGLCSADSSKFDCRSRVASLIPARSHTFMEIDRAIISMVSLHLPLIGCCQLQAKVCVQITD